MKKYEKILKELESIDWDYGKPMNFSATKEGGEAERGWDLAEKYYHTIILRIIDRY